MPIWKKRYICVCMDNLFAIVDVVVVASGGIDRQVSDRKCTMFKTIGDMVSLLLVSMSGT